MALEIQEIGIRLRVDPDDPAPGVPLAAESVGETKEPEPCCGPSQADRAAIVHDCVRRVLRALYAHGRR